MNALMSGLRVLVVDDNADSAEALAALFTYEGASARVELHATNIVDVVREFEPQLILLDLDLPGVSGLDACRLIRNQKGDEVYVASVTGWGRPEDAHTCRGNGFDEHLVKPVHWESLKRLAAAATAHANRSVLSR